LDEAARIADEAPADAALADVAAAVWAARGQMGHAQAVYTALAEPATGDAAAIVAFALGDPGTTAPSDASVTPPTTLHIAMDLLRRGLHDTTTAASGAAVAELEGAAELYSSSGATAPIAELPAVIAASAAIALGDLDAAQAVLDDALDAGHGGQWAQPRLLLWRAWVAVLRARPLDARAALEDALRAGRDRLAPRDAFLASTVRIAIARRYEDDAALDAAWTRARRDIMRVDVDVFLLSPLAELVSSAAKLGQSETMRAPLAAAVALVDRLGSPVWAAHVHWAGIQQGILLSRPAELTPHARALVAAGHSSHVAAAMARAGRVWTAVLGGTVDADAVESATDALAEVGLAWDGARLAGHGASRTDDRRIAARLLARARELHPTDATRRPASDQPATAADDLLSERELEVARLVVQGRTYAEIGATIFISPRTVEHHIAHIRRRLGAASRSDLIGRLRALLAEEADPRGAGESSPVLAPAGIGVPPDADGRPIS
ncbi:MAG TPA: helix-turn-helix transcriptional regulator, partial [Microbacterium sp.]|nr:helix-turn-helix transcriptional regulator [Microbacterium sp.]